MKRTAMLLVLGALLAASLAGCGGDAAREGPTAATVVTAEQVHAIAANLLEAYNSGDYQAFSRDLSLPAKLIVDQAAFAGFRAENLPVTGPYVAITGIQVEPRRQDPDHASYLVRARFEQHDVAALVLTVSRSGEVDGLELSPRSEG
jgi:ribosomal protein S18 acetylase RimI-like enzyme